MPNGNDSPTWREYELALFLGEQTRVGNLLGLTKGKRELLGGAQVGFILGCSSPPFSLLLYLFSRFYPPAFYCCACNSFVCSRSSSRISCSRAVVSVP
eukprot:SAG31_NODE_19305_length_606_cov_1.420118_1_plen_97_part_10